MTSSQLVNTLPGGVTYGSATLNGGDAIRRDTIFRIASLTKPVVAVAALILVEECGLRLDDPVDEIRRSHESFDPLRDPQMRPTPFQAYLRIQIGCDKFCSYCVVPMTRGPEQGRPPEQIVAEARVLADQGCKEITLLGQTVNSYQYRSAGRTTRFSDLLAAVHEVPGIERGHHPGGSGTLEHEEHAQSLTDLSLQPTEFSKRSLDSLLALRHALGQHHRTCVEPA